MWQSAASWALALHCRAALDNALVRSPDGNLNIITAAIVIRQYVQNAVDRKSAQWIVCNILPSEIPRKISLKEYVDLLIELKWDSFLTQPIYQIGQSIAFPTRAEIDAVTPPTTLVKLYTAMIHTTLITENEELLMTSFKSLAAAQQIAALEVAMPALARSATHSEAVEDCLHRSLPNISWEYVSESEKNWQTERFAHTRWECVQTQANCAVECALAILEDEREMPNTRQHLGSIVRLALSVVPSQTALIALGLAKQLRTTRLSALYRRQLRDAFIEVSSGSSAKVLRTVRSEFQTTKSDTMKDWYSIPELGEYAQNTLDTMFSQASAEATEALSRMSAISSLAPYAAIQWLVSILPSYGSYPKILQPVVDAVWPMSESLGLSLLMSALSDQWIRLSSKPVSTDAVRGVQAVCLHLTQSGQVRQSSVVRSVVLKLVRSTTASIAIAGATLVPVLVDGDTDVRSAVCVLAALHAIDRQSEVVGDAVEHAAAVVKEKGKEDQRLAAWLSSVTHTQVNRVSRGHGHD